MKLLLFFTVILFTTPVFSQLYFTRTENDSAFTYAVLDIAGIKTHNGESAISIVIDENNPTSFCTGNLDCFISEKDVLTLTSTIISGTRESKFEWTRIGKKSAALVFRPIRQTVNGKTIHYLKSDFLNGYVFYLLRLEDITCGPGKSCAKFLLEAHYASPPANYPFVTPDDVPTKAVWADVFNGTPTQPSSGSGHQPPPRP